jgi:hypothetical protein
MVQRSLAVAFDISSTFIRLCTTLWYRSPQPRASSRRHREVVHSAIGDDPGLAYRSSVSKFGRMNEHVALFPGIVNPQALCPS